MNLSSDLASAWSATQSRQVHSALGRTNRSGPQICAHASARGPTRGGETLVAQCRRHHRLLGGRKFSIVCPGLFPALSRKKGLGDESAWRIVPPNRCSNLRRPSTRQRSSAIPSSGLRRSTQTPSSSVPAKVNLAEFVRAPLNQDTGGTRILISINGKELRPRRRAGGEERRKIRCSRPKTSSAPRCLPCV